MTKNWFEEWFDKDYLDLYANRDDSDALKQIDLLENTVTTKPQTILDVGCGEGRHVKLFHDRGYTTTGIDISKNLIDIGKHRHPQLDLLHTSTGELIQTIQENKKNHHDSEGYDLVTSLFTCFGYYDTHAENRQFLKEMTQLIRPNGGFWFDFLNQNQILATPLKDTTTEINGQDKSPTRLFHQQRKIVEKEADNTSHLRIEKTITISLTSKTTSTTTSQANSQTYPRKITESVRLYSPKELRIMFEEVGLTIQKEFGDYLGTPLHQAVPSSQPPQPRVIFYALKK